MSLPRRFGLGLLLCWASCSGSSAAPDSGTGNEDGARAPMRVVTGEDATVAAPTGDGGDAPCDGSHACPYGQACYGSVCKKAGTRAAGQQCLNDLECLPSLRCLDDNGVLLCTDCSGKNPLCN
jgi:hypothetical protein